VATHSTLGTAVFVQPYEVLGRARTGGGASTSSHAERVITYDVPDALASVTTWAGAFDPWRYRSGYLVVVGSDYSITAPGAWSTG